MGNNSTNYIDDLGLTAFQERSFLDIKSLGTTVSQDYRVRQKYYDPEVLKHWRALGPGAQPPYSWRFENRNATHTINLSATVNVPLEVNVKSESVSVNMEVTTNNLKGLNGKFNTGPVKFVWSEHVVSGVDAKIFGDPNWTSYTEDGVKYKKVKFIITAQLPIDISRTTEVNLGFVMPGKWEVVGGAGGTSVFGVTLDGLFDVEAVYKCTDGDNYERVSYDTGERRDP